MADGHAVRRGVHQVIVDLTTERILKLLASTQMQWLAWVVLYGIEVHLMHRASASLVGVLSRRPCESLRQRRGHVMSSCQPTQPVRA